MLMVVHALFPLETLIGNVHLLLDVIKRCLFQKGCEDNSPIVIADPRDELTVFGKTEYRALTVYCSFRKNCKKANYAYCPYIYMLCHRALT
jgi:hypothetical protein